MTILCDKCNVPMTDGQAFQDVLTGIGDFSENDDVATLSYGTKAKLIECWKCPECGHSVTKGE